MIDISDFLSFHYFIKEINSIDISGGSLAKPDTPGTNSGNSVYNTFITNILLDDTTQVLNNLSKSDNEELVGKLYVGGNGDLGKYKLDFMSGPDGYCRLYYGDNIANPRSAYVITGDTTMEGFSLDSHPYLESM